VRFKRVSTKNLNQHFDLGGPGLPLATSLPFNWIHYRSATSKTAPSG